jgi:hypothetical protein
MLAQSFTLIPLSLLLFIPLPARADDIVVPKEQSSISHISISKDSVDGVQQQCDSAVRKAVNRFEETRNIDVADISKINLSERYSNYPPNAPIGVAFGLVGEAVPDIMNSSQLMTAISTQLIIECPPVSWIRIGQYQTGFYAIFGLVDGSVSAFQQCQDAGIGRRLLRWGERYCL